MQIAKDNMMILNLKDQKNSTKTFLEKLAISAK
jgi:hypothetical protein